MEQSINTRINKLYQKKASASTQLKFAKEPRSYNKKSIDYYNNMIQNLSSQITDLKHAQE